MMGRIAGRTGVKLAEVARVADCFSRYMVQLIVSIYSCTWQISWVDKCSCFQFYWDRQIAPTGVRCSSVIKSMSFSSVFIHLNLANIVYFLLYAYNDPQRMLE